MKIRRVGYINDISIEVARKISDVLNQDDYRTEIVKTDIGDGYEINVYTEIKRKKRWWC